MLLLLVWFYVAKTLCDVCMCVCSSRVRLLFQMSLVVSVTHLNLGRPTLRFGGFHGIVLFSLFGPNVMCLTGWSCSSLLILAHLLILVVGMILQMGLLSLVSFLLWFHFECVRLLARRPLHWYSFSTKAIFIFSCCSQSFQFEHFYPALGWVVLLPCRIGVLLMWKKRTVHT